MLNVVALNGRLTADSELRHTNNDIAVTAFKAQRNGVESNGKPYSCYL